MRILVLLLVGLFLSNCSNSYVKNKNYYFARRPYEIYKYMVRKAETDDNVIKMCGQGYQKI